MTLVVLGLDGLDARNIVEFSIDEMELESHGKMESIAYNRSEPHTTQVWPTMATGLSPEIHGMGVDRASEWDNVLVEFLSKNLAPHISLDWRVKLGNIVSQTTGEDWDFATVDQETFFDGPGRFCHNWPGVDNSALKEVWDEIEYAHNSSSPQESFNREMWSLAGEKFGWIFEMLNHDVALLGIQIHLLDSLGHAYATQYDHYKSHHERVGEYIEKLKGAMTKDDELLIVSDHGMQVEWFDDEVIAEHSFYSFSASTLDTRPESVMDVKSWIETNIKPHEENYLDSSETEMNLPTERLEDLGYI